MSSKLIAITGGIGCGKSVVSKIITLLGYQVYDCDSRAKRIMDSDEKIKNKISERVCAAAITPDGQIDRKALSDVVFSDNEKLNELNQIVHGAVRVDLAQWVRANSCYGKPLFVETAILRESGLDKMVERVIVVTAPAEIRIRRVMSRNSCLREDVVKRIESQERSGIAFGSDDMYIDNSGDLALLPQIQRIINEVD